MKPKKDILFLCQFFHPEYISSAQLPFDTAKALQKSGLSVDVLCGYQKNTTTAPRFPSRKPFPALAFIGFPICSPAEATFSDGF